MTMCAALADAVIPSCVASRPNMMRLARASVLAGVCFVGLCGLGACASEQASTRADDSVELASSRASIEPAAYPYVFDSAKHVLRDLGFVLDRVDAQAGVIVTKPLGSAGLATPWDQVQSGFDQELEDLAQNQTRVARIDFVPKGVGEGASAGEASAAGAEGVTIVPDDLRAYVGPIEARVGVTVFRVNRSGRRLNSGSIDRSTWTVDADLAERGLLGYSVAIKQDRRLADRIVAQMQRQRASDVSAAR